MTELSRSLLAAAREGLAPDAAALARVRAKVAAAVAAAPGSAIATATPTPVAAKSSLLLKLGIVLGVAAGIATTAFVISGDRGINLAIATWHWGPYPLGPEVQLANFQARDVADDNEVAHLARDLDTVVEIRV